jgi:hypothetical protein
MRSPGVQKAIDDARARAVPRHRNTRESPARLRKFQVSGHEVEMLLTGAGLPDNLPPGVRLVGWEIAVDLNPPTLTLTLESPDFPEVAPGAPIPGGMLTWNLTPAAAAVH